MATTPNGFWYPSPGDTINSISGLFAQQAASAETALNARMLQDGVPKFVDATARTAAYAGVPPLTGSMSYLESTGLYEKWNGTSWEPITAINPPAAFARGDWVGSHTFSGPWFYTPTLVSFTLRADTTALLFGSYIITKVTGDSAVSRTGNRIQYRVNGGTWTDAPHTGAGFTSGNVYAMSSTGTIVNVVPPAETDRSIDVRGSSIQNVGSGGRLDRWEVYALAFNESEVL